MASEIKNTISIQEGYYFTGNSTGLVLRLVHPDICGSESMAMGLVFLNPGEEVFPHQHESEEGYFVISGTGYMTIGDKEFELKPNMALYMPPNAPHYTKNTGEDSLKILFAMPKAPTAKNKADNK